MQSDDSIQKTLGPQSANLITSLYSEEREIFHIEDVCRLTGLSAKSARSLVGKLVKRGIVTRLKPGLYNIVPMQLGKEMEYVGDPYLIAASLVGETEYYISHASAMDIHGMLTQPQFVVFVTVSSPLRCVSIHGIDYRFVHSKPDYFFGITDHWAKKTQTVKVSDLEKTIIDGLKMPQYCGGISEVAKALWIRKSDIDTNKLVDYADRLDIDVARKRLGFLLELFNLGTEPLLNYLLERTTRPYPLFDPSLPDEGSFSARWKMRLNVEPQEILSIIRT